MCVCVCVRPEHSSETAGNGSPVRACLYDGAVAKQSLAKCPSLFLTAQSLIIAAVLIQPFIRKADYSRVNTPLSVFYRKTLHDLLRQ